METAARPDTTADDLLAENRRLREVEARLTAELAEVKDKLSEAEGKLADTEAELEKSQGENAALKRQIEAQERSSKRQAAPFAKGEKKANPKKPGRKAGQGTFKRRSPPDPEAITHTVAVPLASDRCPFCNSANLSDVRGDDAYCTDLPAAPKPEVIHYRIEVRTCLDCGRTVRGQHPEVAPTQVGATAHRLGDGIMARAHVLHYGLGIPMRKVPAVLHELCGVTVTQSALMQDAIRRSQGEIGQEYDRLRAGVAASKRVFTDDTGWRIDGEPAQMMAFETDEASVYQIRRQHRNEEVRELVPSDYGGILHTDRGRSYDANELEMVAQQKCCFHILRSIDKVLEHKQGSARAFGETLKGLIHDAIHLWHRYHQEDVAAYPAEAKRLKEAFDEHLKPRVLDDPDNQRLLDQLAWHHVGGNLLRFLENPALAEPTNNRAERALRPAVIARKVSHCSKNEAGAHAYASFKTVLETIRKRGHSLVDGLTNLFRSSSKATPPAELASSAPAPATS